MHEEVIVSGFGGQGALFAGQLLTYTGMDKGHQVTWIPSYGPEMRGGTAHCTVILSDDPIGSPIIRNPTAAIVMNPPSMEKYESLIKPGGVLIADNTLWSGRVLAPETDSARAIVAFNDHVKNDTRVEHVLLAVRDGIMLARKKVV